MRNKRWTVGAVAAATVLGGGLFAASPAQALPDNLGVNSVVGGSAPGTISVEFTLPEGALLALWVAPASTAPEACSFEAWEAKFGVWNWISVDTFDSDLQDKASPIEIGSLVPGEEYVVCLGDSLDTYGDNVFGFAAGPASQGGAAGGTPAVSCTLTSNPNDRGTCWPTVSGVGGTWVQLTDSGCTPPTTGATLLGWATSPDFPVARAKNGVVVDEEFGGVRMIFIPLNGYTFLSGDNTLYPIWSS